MASAVAQCLQQFFPMLHLSYCAVSCALWAVTAYLIVFKTVYNACTKYKYLLFKRGISVSQLYTLLPQACQITF